MHMYRVFRISKNSSETESIKWGTQRTSSALTVWPKLYQRWQLRFRLSVHLFFLIFLGLFLALSILLPLKKMSVEILVVYTVCSVVFSSFISVAPTFVWNYQYIFYEHEHCKLTQHNNLSIYFNKWDAPNPSICLISPLSPSLFPCLVSLPELTKSSRIFIYATRTGLDNPLQ